MYDHENEKGPWEDFARAAEEFGESMKDMFAGLGCCGRPHAPGGPEPFGPHPFGGPKPDRPRTNSWTAADGSLVFEILLPGFEMSQIDLGFSGDIMYLSATRPAKAEGEGPEEVHAGFCIKDIERREYPVPASRFDQKKAVAQLRAGILHVSIPPKEASEAVPEVKIEIVGD